MMRAQGRAVRSDRIERGGTRLRLGAALALVTIAWTASPASAADVTLTDLRFEAGPAIYRIPTAEFRGTSLSKDELTALLSATSTEPVAARIVRIQADSIVVPEMRSETTAPSRTVTVYRDIVFSKVAGGRIESATSASGTIEGETPEGKMTGGLGRMSLKGIDLGLAVALMTTKAAGPAEPLKTIYQEMSLEGLTFSDDKGHAFRVARFAGSDFAARPTKDGWSATMLLMQPNKDPKDDTPEQKSRRFAALADLFDAFRIGSMEGTGITFGEKGKELGRIEKVGFRGTGDPGITGFRIEGIDVSPPDGGRIRLASYELSGFSMRPMFSILASAPDGDLSKLSQAEIRKMIPSVGTVRISGIEVDVVTDKPASPDAPTVVRPRGLGTPAEPPAPTVARPRFGAPDPAQKTDRAAESPWGHEGSPGTAAPPSGPARPPAGPATSPAGPAARTARISVGSFEIATDKAVEGIPTDIRIGLRNVAFPVTGLPDNPGIERLAAMGYDKVDASFMASLGWNEPGQEIVIRELSLQGVGMGSTVIRAVIGGITRQAFAPDTTAATMALLGASGKSLELAVDDQGLVNRVLAMLAKDQKRSVEDIRKEYVNAAMVGIPAMLGNSPNSRAIGQAVANFLTKPGKLSISAKAKKPSGFGFADYMQAPDPASILSALDITAVAN